MQPSLLVELGLIDGVAKKAIKQSRRFLLQLLSDDLRRLVAQFQTRVALDDLLPGVYAKADVQSGLGHAQGSQ